MPLQRKKESEGRTSGERLREKIEHIEHTESNFAYTASADPNDMGAGPIAPIGLPVIDPLRYEVLGEFARGGLGRILKVRDLRLGRTVALKEMLRDSDAAYTRFAREALLTARLEHPAIVPIHEIGRWPTGEPFYAMKLVSGRSLHEVIRAAGTLNERLALLPNVIAVADAIAYAHSQGIIHRDLKPANVLVGAFGETVVIDWGLAKDLHQSEDGISDNDATLLPSNDALTVVGAVMGTPQYMPPEQARGLSVDERADVYALGAMLYDMLVGGTPYPSGPSSEVLAAVLAGPPPAMETRVDGIPLDLAAIVHKAMEREPEARYPTAGELVEDLRRFQTGRLVSAHHYSRWTLMLRWLRRHRAPVSVAVAAIGLLSVLAIVGVQRIVAERNIAEKRANQLVLTQARGVLERDPTEALAWLRSYPASGEDFHELRDLAVEAESRGIARHLLPSRVFYDFTADGKGFVGAPDGQNIEVRDVESGALLRRLPHRGHTSMIYAVPKGHTLAVLNESSDVISLIDILSGTSRVLRGHEGPITVIAVSPDGRWIASGGADKTVRLWPTGAGEPRVLRVLEGAPSKLVFSSDGRWLLSRAEEPTSARIFHVEGEEQYRISGPSDVFDLTLSPDGSLVSIAQQDGTVSLWSAEGALLRTLQNSNDQLSTLVFSPDNRWIASGWSDGRVQLWSLHGEAHRVIRAHKSQVRWLLFSPDGRTLFSVSNDGELRLFDVDSDKERVLGRSSGRMTSLYVASDGRHVATMGDQGVVRIWDVTDPDERVLRGEGSDIHGMAFSPDNRILATANSDKRVRVWDLATGQSQELVGHQNHVLRVAFSPDNKVLASGGYDGTLRLWDFSACVAPPGREGCVPKARAFNGHAGWVSTLAYSPDGHLIATGGEDATVRLWDTENGEARVLRGHTGYVQHLAFSPDGRQLASGGADHLLWLWDLSSVTGRPLAGHKERIYWLAYSMDGRSIFTASDDQTIRRWQTGTGAMEIIVHDAGRSTRFGLSSDGRWIAFSDRDNHVCLEDLITRERRCPGGHQKEITWIDFTPDGKRLVSASRDRSVRLWDVQRGELVSVLWHDAEASIMGISPDAQWLAAGGAGSTMRLWNPRAHTEAPTTPEALKSWMASLSTATLDAQQRLSTPLSHVSHGELAITPTSELGP